MVGVGAGSWQTGWFGLLYAANVTVGLGTFQHQGSFFNAHETLLLVDMGKQINLLYDRRAVVLHNVHAVAISIAITVAKLIQYLDVRG